MMTSYDKDDEDLPLYSGILLLYFNREDLSRQISKRLGHQYLSELKENEKQFQETREGILYGPSYNSLFSIPVRYEENKPRWIHFLIVTASMNTFLSDEALRALVGPNKHVQQNTIVFINGEKVRARRSIGRFDFMNILGMDFLIRRAELKFSFPKMENQSVTLRF